MPLRLAVQTSINPVRQQAQQIVKSALDSIGFDVVLKNIDSSIFLGAVEGTTETRRQFYADLEEFAFSNKSPDPAVYMGGWTCGQIAQKADNWSLSNFARYCDPAFDDLFSRSRTELDPTARVALFKQMNDKLVDDGAVIPLVHLADVSGRGLGRAGPQPDALGRRGLEHRRLDAKLGRDDRTRGAAEAPATPGDVV